MPPKKRRFIESTAGVPKPTAQPNVPVRGSQPEITEMSVFRSQLHAFAKEGLDLPKFEAWLEEHEESLEWPSGSLADYFTEMARTAGWTDQVDQDYFRLLGIVDDPEKLQSFLEYYDDCEPLGLLPEDCLSIFFTEVAQRVRYEISILRWETYPAAEAAINANITALSRGLSPQISEQVVQLNVQKPSSNPCTPPEFVLQEFTLLEELPEAEEFLYHTTSLRNAASIIATCPFIGQQSRYTRDMDTGVYYNVSSVPANDWAEKAILSKGLDAAILVYRVPKEVRAQWRILSLDYGTDWANLVRAFRRQEYAAINLSGIQSNYDVISGPILANPREVVYRDTPPLPLNYQQVCILDRAIGARMNNYLVGIVVIRAGKGNE